MEVEVRRSADRFHTTGAGRSTWHSFSFGDHYDPADLRHGRLLAHNDELLEPGAGYPPHRHHGVQIVTWVVEGRLRHEDETGAAVLGPGWVQVSVTGRGIEHAERNAESPPAGRPVRFLQAWLSVDDPDQEPVHHRRDLGALLASGELVPATDPGPAVLLVGRLAGGRTVTVPVAPYAHVFVARGTVHLQTAGVLAEGDAARLTDAGPLRLTARTDAEVLVWAMQR